MFVTRDEKLRWTETVHDATERVVGKCCMSDEGFVVIVGEHDPKKRRVEWIAQPAEGHRVLARVRKETPGYIVARRDVTPTVVMVRGRLVRPEHAWDLLEVAIEKHALSPWYVRDGEGVTYKAYDAKSSVRLATVSLFLVHAMTTFDVDIEESLSLRGLDGISDSWLE